MGRCGSKRRSMVIRQKQKRRAKLGKLREKHIKTRSEIEKSTIWEKVLKIAPWLTKEEFLAPAKKKEEEKEEKKKGEKKEKKKKKKKQAKKTKKTKKKKVKKEKKD